MKLTILLLIEDDEDSDPLSPILENEASEFVLFTGCPFRRRVVVDREWSDLFSDR